MMNKSNKIVKRKSSAKNTIRLELEGSMIRADDFTRSVRDFFDLINDVAAEVTEKRRAVEWVVSVEQGSIAVCATAISVNGDRASAGKTVRAVRDGIEAIGKRQKRPNYFTNNALRKLSDLGAIVGPKAKGIDSVHIGIGTKWNDISPSSVAYVDELLNTPTMAYGTIEGDLLAVNVRGSLKFSVYEDLSGKEVKCYFDDNIYGDVIAAIRKRVSVYGLIKYRKGGEPASVNIEKLCVFPESDKLPKFNDIIGLFAE